VVNDKKVDKNAKFAREHGIFPLVVVASKTNRPFGVLRPGFKFRITDSGCYTFDETGAVTAQLLVMGTEGLISAPTFSVNAAPEKFDTTAFVGRAASTFVEKAAAAAQLFTAAHVISLATFGVVLFQMDSAGTITSKVPLATQAYPTAAQALAALPAPDANKVALGYLAIAAKAGTAWTANTDDLTNGSDVATAAFTSGAVTAAALSSALAFADGAYVAGALSTTLATLKGTAVQDIVVIYTSDGTGALVNGHVNVQFRPTPMDNEA